MRDTALLVLALASLVGCSSSTDSSMAQHDAEPHEAANVPSGFAYEESRDDLVCRSDEDVREAQEPLTPLAFVCASLVGTCFAFGCGKLLSAACPVGTTKVIHDTMDDSKTIAVNCTMLDALLCSTGARATLPSLLRVFCGIM